MPDWPRHDLLRHRAASTPEGTAIIGDDTDTVRDWDTFDTAVGRLASRLTDIVDPGDRAGLVLPTGVDFVDTYWAIVRSGGSAVPVDPDRPAPDLGNRLRRAGVTCVFTDSASEDDCRDVVDVPVYTVTGDSPQGDGAIRPGTGTAPPTDRHPNDEQVVLFTSGTTGTPKGVRLTDRNLLMNAIGSAFRLGTRPDDRWLDCLPMHHMGGLAPIIRTAAYGTTLVVQRAFDVDSTPSTIRDRGITGISLVPTMLYRLLEQDWDPPDHLRTVLLGGAPAGRPLVERTLEADVPLFVTYGLTEAASQVTTAAPALLATKPDTVGNPLLVTDVTIVDEDGQACPPGQVGELHVDGPTVASAYLDRDQTTAAYTDRGLATGDLARRDDDGHVFILGRVDDRILTGGETVTPSVVEEALVSHPDIARAAVVGLDDSEWGQRVAALLVPDADAPPDAADVRSFSSERLAPFEQPKTVAFTDHLPRTPSGTIDRDAVRERLRSAASDDHI